MRNQGWEKAIDNYIQEVSLKDFKWGECDCLLFVSDACKIICNIDPMAYKLENDPETIRGLYQSEKEARDLIKQYRKSIKNIMDVHFKQVKPAFAQRGDVVLDKLENGLTFGLIWNGKAFFKTTAQGFITKPFNECKYAWRVC